MLVGTATYLTPELGDLHQAVTNVYELADVLAGPDGVFDRAYVTPVADPRTAEEVLDPLAGQGGPEVELVLFYYAGHGLLGPAGSLCFGLPGSVPGDADRTSLRAADLFAVMERLRARHKVAILDCCFSGRALDVPSASGVHLLTATNRTSKARSERDRTAFTRELLDLLETGVPDGPGYLSLDTIYRRLAAVLPAPYPKRFPEPWQRSFNWTGDLALVRNAAYGTARTRGGLRARARFAEQLAATRAAAAAELFEGIVADAVAEYSPVDHDTARYRHAHASLVGRAGGASLAVELLDALIRELPEGDTLEAVRASRVHWSSRRGVTS